VTMFDKSHCARCLCANPADDLDDLPTDWEVLTDTSGEVIGVVCPDCLTAAEQQALDEDAMDAAGPGDSEEGQ
jgi:hypothetical protein